MRWPNSFLNHAPLAIAYAALGKKDIANEHLQQSRQSVSLLEDATEMENSFPETPWFDLVELRLLHAEAERAVSALN